MSTYLYSIEREPLTHSTSLSRLILALVAPYVPAADQAFLLEAGAVRDAEIDKLRLAGVQLGFGAYELHDPLDGWEGVRGKAFQLADQVLPRHLDDVLVEALLERKFDLADAQQNFQRAREFIQAQAISGADILVM